MIAVEVESTAGTLVYPDIKRHCLPMVTPAAILTGIGRVDCNVRAPSFLRFGSKLVEEFRPRSVLQDLGMNLVQGRPLLFQYRIGGLLLVEREAFTSLLIGITPFLKQVVIQPSAFFKDGAQLLCFLLAWVDTITKHFTHARIMHLNGMIVKYRATCVARPFIPVLKSWGLLAAYGNICR